MFTGIIEEVGRVEVFAPAASAWTLQISGQLVPSSVAVGDSVAVNGCCLTVTRFAAGQLCFDVLEETRRLTNFNELAVGAAVNLERSLQPSGRMGGHFVTGHIDALGTVAILEPRGKDHYLRVTVPTGSARYLVSKGSVALDGISLTIAEVGDDSLAVWLIPHTLAVTNLREKRVGSGVNVEVDLLAKYVEKLLASNLR